MSSSSDAPRPGSWLATGGPAAGAGPTADGPAEDLAVRLAGVPVAGHADVLAAEHDRLHRLLATIDQL
jgi:hypothetical protein